MGRSVVRKRAFEEMKDELTNSRRSETMEVDQAETFEDDGELILPKEKIVEYPEIDWDAVRLDLDDEEWDALQASLAQTRERQRKEALDPETAARERRLRMQETEKMMAERRREKENEKMGQEYLVEACEEAAAKYRDDWNAIWSVRYGSFEDTTRIPAMRFTHNKPAPELHVDVCETLQVFSAKVASTSGGLQWPLDVFGFVAMRDNMDRNRNIIFNRTRDSCQTLTQEDNSLALVGPSRAVFVSNPHPVIIEVELKVKGSTESEDKQLSFLAVPLSCTFFYSRLLHCSYTSKLSTLEFTLGYLDSSVEATIFVRVTRGSWPDGFRCEFSAFVVCENIDYGKNNAAGDIDHEKIVLFDSRGEEGIVDNDGNIKLSRRVVSVEIRGQLKVSFKAWKVDTDVVEREEVFTPSRAGLSYRDIHIGFCKMEVSVAWSLISYSPVLADAEL